MQVLGYTMYKEMIRLTGTVKPAPAEEQEEWRDLIFEEQPYLANVYPGDTRSIGIIYCIRDMSIEYFNLGVNPEHTMCVADGPDFPDSFKPLAAAMAKALGELRQRSDVKWTYISPAGDFQADGERTGRYILGGEELTLNSRGESIICRQGRHNGGPACLYPASSRNANVPSMTHYNFWFRVAFYLNH